MKLAKKIEKLGTETAFDVLAKVTALRAKGRDIISFSIGEPDYDTPKNIKDAAEQAIDNNITHYQPANGMPELRNTIAETSQQLRGVHVNPEEVVVTPGAKPILFHTILALINPGDEVVYPSPGFPIYESLINFIGAKAVPLPLEEEKEFSVDTKKLEYLISPKTKLIILNSPHNPTGGILSQNDMKIIGDLAIENNSYVLSDEIYHRFIYEGEFTSISSIPEMKNRTIIVDGCSKTYAMTGWRIGWGIMPKELAKIITRLIINAESCTAAFTQIAAIEALKGDQEESYKMVHEFKIRRNLIVDLLNQVKGVTCLHGKGAFYVFPNVTRACRELGLQNAEQLQDYLLNEAGVAVLARTCFGSRNTGETDEYLRISYSVPQETIQEGIKRIQDAIEHPKKLQKYQKIAS